MTPLASTSTSANVKYSGKWKFIWLINSKFHTKTYWNDDECEAGKGARELEIKNTHTTKEFNSNDGAFIYSFHKIDSNIRLILVFCCKTQIINDCEDMWHFWSFQCHLWFYFALEPSIVYDFCSMYIAKWMVYWPLVRSESHCTTVDNVQFYPKQVQPASYNLWNTKTNMKLLC